jgi:type IV pilus assembly protein PilW
MIIHKNLRSREKLNGFSLIELMIAIAIGLFIMGVVAAIFVSTSRSFRDLQKSGEQIENGRFALSQIGEDLHHAGYFGQLAVFPAATANPDPCIKPVLGDLASPIQVYSAPSLTTKITTTLTCLDAAEIAAGSDILVIRRADTLALTGNSLPGTPYLAANPVEGEILDGTGGALTTTIKNKNGTQAPIRRLRTHIYYVSPCSAESCASSSDGIPTLKRKEILSGTASPTTWTTSPLASGIEYMQIDLGVDNKPGLPVNVSTGTIGDGAADERKATLAEVPGATWGDVVSVQVNLLARTLETVIGHNDKNKTYNLGIAGTVTNMNDAFKRKAFTADARLNNPSGRRERLVAGE